MKKNFTITALVILGFLFPLVTFSQVDPPEISCAGNKTVNLGANCQVAVDLSEGVSTKGVALSSLQYAVSPSSGILSGTNLTFFGSGNFTVTVSFGRVECSYTISVVDVIPPVITCPSNKIVYVNSGQTSAQVSNAYSILDDCGIFGGTNSYQFQNSLGQNFTTGGGGSGSSVLITLTQTETVPLGHNLITASATDLATPSASSSDNTGSCSFTIDVVVTGSPCSINCPSNITVDATSPSGAAVDYSVTSNGDCRDNVTIPPAGTIFPVGTTTVKSYGNVSTGLVYGLNHFTSDFPEPVSIDQLITFNVNSATPTAILSTTNITGTSGWDMKAIDFRPSNGQLYGLGVAWLASATPHYVARLFTINKSTGAAAAVNIDYIDLTDAISIDMDFDPVTDKLRVTDGKGTNLRIDPDLGTVIATDPALSAGFTATAYSNNFSSSTFTSLYQISASTNGLYVQGGINGVPSPNTGTTTLVGQLGIDVEGAITGFGGFDISPSTGALATFLGTGGFKLYSINLSTGEATLIGTLTGSINDIAIAPLTLPTPSCSFTITVNPPPLRVTINKAAGQADPTSSTPVHFTVVFDQDVTGFDASDISFAGSTVNGTLAANVTGGGPTYDVSVSGMTSSGDIMTNVIAGAATSNSGQASLVSTSTDNVVSFIKPEPVITCPANYTKEAEGISLCFANIDFATDPHATATGFPTPTISYTIVDDKDQSVVNTGAPGSLRVGEYTVTAIASNSAGTASCSYKISVVPLLPTITCPGNYTVTADPSLCKQSIHFTSGEHAITHTNSLNNYQFSWIDQNGITGSTTNTSVEFFVGVYTITAKVFGCDGHPASCSFVLTVAEPAVDITCPGNITLPDNNNDCQEVITLTGSYAVTGTVSNRTYKWTNANGVSGTVVTRRSEIPPPFTFPVGINYIKVIAEGCVASKDSCEFTVTVTESIPPVITCPSNVTVSCAKDVPPVNIGAVTATDNCGIPIVTHVSDVISNQICANKYTITRTYKATDGAGNTAICSQVITVDDNTPPQITGLTPSKRILAPPNHKMVDVTLSYSVSDNCVSTPNVTVSITSNEPVNGTGDGDTDPDWEIIDAHHIRLRAERSGQGTGRIYTITVTVNDGCNAPVSASTEVMVVHNITGPNSGNSFKIGSTVAFTGEFWDVSANKHTAKWSIDGTSVNGIITEPSGTKNGKVTGSYKFTTPGVYKLQMNITDQKGVTTYANTNGDLEAIVVIYDPNGGYTYGGGFYNSPAGALLSDPSSTGKASYGFAMNYFKNSTNPKGETQFDFKVGDFEFNALNFDYLVISSSMSQFKGTGKITGSQSGIGFTMTVVDGQLDGTGIDKIRMKIYNKNNGKIIYDNQPDASDAALPTQSVGANSIIVISGTNTSLPSANSIQKAEMETSGAEVMNGLDATVYPNPASHYFNISVTSNNAKEKIVLQVVDQYGRVIETRNNISNGSAVRLGNLYRSGVYYVRVLQGKQHKELKLVKLSD